MECGYNIKGWMLSPADFWEKSLCYVVMSLTNSEFNTLIPPALLLIDTWMFFNPTIIKLSCTLQGHALPTSSQYAHIEIHIQNAPISNILHMYKTMHTICLSSEWPKHSYVIPHKLKIFPVLHAVQKRMAFLFESGSFKVPSWTIK